MLFWFLFVLLVVVVGFVLFFFLSWIMLLWTFVYRFVQTRVFIFLRWIPGIGLARLYSKSLFNIFRHCCFLEGLYQQCMRIPAALHPCQLSVWQVFKNFSYPDRCVVDVIVVSICISLMMLSIFLCAYWLFLFFGDPSLLKLFRTGIV